MDDALLLWSWVFCLVNSVFIMLSEMSSVPQISAFLINSKITISLSSSRDSNWSQSSCIFSALSAALPEKGFIFGLMRRLNRCFHFLSQRPSQTDRTESISLGSSWSSSSIAWGYWGFSVFVGLVRNFM